MAKHSPYALLPEGIMYTQTDALKEVKDMSKNLVSGEFEREYRGGMVDQCRGRRKLACWASVVTVAVFFFWLLTLTVVREVQLARLRQELDQLSANMIAMSATLNGLNQKVSSNRLFEEFKALEDTIYADVDQDGIPVEEASQQPGEASMQKLSGLTVLEDEDEDLLDDDEDLYDEDDAESGDWYPDYDRRREKIGRANMVKLKPSDFTGSVVTVASDKQLSNSMIRQIKRLLNEDPENTNISLPTEASKEEKTTGEQERAKRSVFPDSSKDSVDRFAAPRDLAKMDERRKSKKFLPSVEQLKSGKVTTHSSARTARNSEDEFGSRRPFIAAHFHGNTSHLSPEIHEHYKGNGLVRVSHDAPHDVWYPAPWTLASPHPRPTLTRSGHVHVHHTGVYLVYVQIYYLDSHDVIAWVLHRTNAETDGREALLQCAQSAHTPEPRDKPNSCFSASALFLKAGDRLAVRNTRGDVHSIMQPEKSFIGLIKLADAEDPDQEL